MTRVRTTVTEPPRAGVMVVADDPDLRTIVREALTPAGVAVIEVFDSDEAVSRFRHAPPDAVLLDATGCGGCAVRTCRVLRMLDGAGHVPLIVAVDSGDAAVLEDAFEAGASDFIACPLHPTKLRHRVQQALRASARWRRLEAQRERLLRAQRLAGLIEWEVDALGVAWLNDDAELLGTRRSAQSRAASRVSLQSVCHADDREALDSALASLRRDHQPLQLDLRLALPDGSERFVHAEGEAEADPRTGSRRSDRFVAVLALDLDLFKRINDTLGHLAGDELLKTVAGRINASLRESDFVGRSPVAKHDEHLSAHGDSAVAARIGGDEFVIVLADLRRIEDAGGVAQRILERLGGAFHLAGQEIYVTASFGIAIYPGNGRTAEELVKNADAAMYSAKDNGRNNFQFYTDSMNAQARHRLELESHLRHALTRGELSLNYQPLVDATSGRVCAVEALLRWRRSDGSMVSPGEFIPIAEDTGLIVPIGDWVLHTACTQLEAWHREGFEELRVAVNVSARQFRDLDLADRVAAVLEQTGLDPRFLELEITESLLMADTEVSRQLLDQLEDLGVSISLDDFGTGYSSLSYLTSFPIDRLKIDRSFVQRLRADSRTAVITRAMIALSRSLELDIVAEGVESKDQLAFFSQYEPIEIQGYYYSRPLAPTELSGWMRKRHANLPSPGARPRHVYQANLH
ncbi:MAG: hypothetical protein CSA66_05795 [Proteobacteria bacterium]|nr:MAG: hypothetical protein CSA66_05795 [Pseudomonadota bacterium]